jgi:hypothetical protein
MNRNNPEINNYRRSMQKTIEYKIMKRSYEIISKWVCVIVIDKEQFLEAIAIYKIKNQSN